MNNNPEKSLPYKVRDNSMILDKSTPDQLTPAHKKLLITQYSHEGIPGERVSAAIDILMEAHRRLRENAHFRAKYGNISPINVLPLMIKESFLDNTRISKTGAIGYFQLKPDAITDAHANLRAIGVQKTYNPNVPVENAILGIIYYDDTQTRLQEATKSKTPLSQEFTLFAYNAGVGKLDKLIEAFQTEKSIKSLPNWETFVTWLVSKIESNTPPKSEKSSEYNVIFRNFFVNDWTKDESILTIGSAKIKKSKIQEAVNYVEKIQAIKITHQGTMRSSDTSRLGPSRPSSPASAIPSIPREIPNPEGKSLPYKKENDGFHGQGWFDEAFYNLKKSLGMNEKYRHIQAVSGKGLDAMLKSGGLPTTPEMRSEFYDINELEKDDPIKAGVYYLLPNIPTHNQNPSSTPASSPASSQQPIPPATSDAPRVSVPAPSFDTREKERLSRDFYAWLNTIEIKNESLKGKLFILDPGHGGGDPGAVPIAVGSDRNPIPYKMSDIKGSPGNEKVTKNGEGDGLLRVVEARVVMDVAYRVAKQLRENGAEVKITHYSQKGIDDTTITQSSNKDAPGLMDEFEYYDTVGDGTKERFNGDSRTGLHKRVSVRNKMLEGRKPQDNYFISLHADRAGSGENLPTNILYEPGNIGQKSFAHSLAIGMGSVRNMSVTAGTRQKGIYILKSQKGAQDQNVLIELGNMNDSSTAYALRSHGYRQNYADAVAKGLIAIATTKKSL